MIQFLYRKFLVKSLRKWVSETRRLCPLLFSSALTSGPTCNWQPSFFRFLCIIKIKLWMDHHKRDAPTLPDNVETARNMQILPWDQEFINVDQEGLSDILIAAHYLDIKPLVQLGCRTGESQLGGKTEGRKQRTSLMTSRLPSLFLFSCWSTTGSSFGSAEEDGKRWLEPFAGGAD